MSTSSVNSDISHLIPEGINTTISSINKPISFGDQILTSVSKTITKSALGASDLLKKDIENVIKQKISLDYTHQQTLLSLDKKHKDKVLTDDEYTLFTSNENISYEKNLQTLQNQQDDLNKRLLIIVKDPYKTNKDKSNKLSNDLKSRKNNSLKNKNIAKTSSSKALSQFSGKTIVPVLTFTLSQVLLRLVDQIGKLQSLVKQTNITIINANTSNDPILLNQARILRDNALKNINDAESNVLNITNQLSRLSAYVNIFNTIISIILAIPILPGGLVVPVGIINNLQKILQNATKIVSGLNVILSIFPLVLSNNINTLETLKTQLLIINGSIESSTVSNNLTNALNSVLSQSNNFGTYKGFTFQIKEEQNPAFIVEGNKRHYAVAVNSQGVGTIVSEYSFTQDPQILVDQLKLQIDSSGVSS